MSRTRLVFAWIAAIVAVFCVQFAALMLGHKLGVPISLDVDPFTVFYGGGFEEERSSITTTYGWGVNVLSVLAGIAVWFPVRGASVSTNGLAAFHGWLLGSAILIIGGIPLWKAFSRSSGIVATLGNVVDAALTVFAVCVGYWLSKSLEAALTNRKR